MPRPSWWLRFRHTLGRALRETGQALDRVGIRGGQQAVTKRKLGDDPYVFDDYLSRHRHQMPLLERGKPLVSSRVAYLAPCSTLIGSVRIGPGASVWYGAVLRADFCENGSSLGDQDTTTFEEAPWTLDEDRVHREKFDESEGIGGGIYIGKDTNVQDGCILTARSGHAVIGEGVTIGHLAQIHSATVKDHSLIGMGSMILEGAVVESEAFIAAGAVVPANTTVPSGELWVGNPARKVRDLSTEERAKLHYQASEYVKVATGQRGVMELGGNIPDTLIEHLMVAGGEIPKSQPGTTQAATNVQSSLPTETTQATHNVRPADEEEEDQPLRASNSR